MFTPGTKCKEFIAAILGLPKTSCGVYTLDGSFAINKAGRNRDILTGMRYK